MKPVQALFFQLIQTEWRDTKQQKLGLLVSHALSLWTRTLRSPLALCVLTTISKCKSMQSFWTSFWLVAFFVLFILFYLSTPRVKRLFPYVSSWVELPAWASSPAWSQPGPGRGGTAAVGEEEGGCALKPKEERQLGHIHESETNINILLLYSEEKFWLFSTGYVVHVHAEILKPWYNHTEENSTVLWHQWMLEIRLNKIPNKNKTFTGDLSIIY